MADICTAARCKGPLAVQLVSRRSTLVNVDQGAGAPVLTLTHLELSRRWPKPRRFSRAQGAGGAAHGDRRAGCQWTVHDLLRGVPGAHVLCYWKSCEEPDSAGAASVLAVCALEHRNMQKSDRSCLQHCIRMWQEGTLYANGRAAGALLALSSQLRGSAGARVRGP